ncbi:putative alpha-glucosidase [Mycena crocata]|nr:putative alpha-glucosidase [Mycena crocata]
MLFPVFALTVAGLVASAPVDNCPGYELTNVSTTSTSLTATLTLAGDACNAYGNDIKDLKLLVEYQTDSRLHVKIYDADEQVYQIPDQFLSLPSGGETSAEDSALKFTYVEKPFSFAVQRSDSQETLFNTSGTELVFETQYIRLRTSLPDDPYIYGLGEDSDPLRRPTSNYTRTFWNVGTSFLPTGRNLYGAHPLYIEMRDGNAHGVFLANSDGMDVKIDNTNGQFLEYNAIGGVFDLYFLSGPSPSDVSQQYSGIVGRPAEQSYWTYGFHQCKYGYKDVQMLAEVVYNYSQANIPLETMWADIDYMDLRRTWTLDPERFPLHKMQELVTYLHDHDQSFIVMVDPPVALNDSASYDKGLKDDVYIKYENGSVFVAAMWPGATSWVDWLHPNAQDYWSGEVSSFFDADSGVNIDGMWIDMNDPANFCPYPCPDPVKWSAENGVPPNPPSIRTTWPPLPGFPDDFQPPESSSRTLSKRQSAAGNHTGLPGRELDDPPYDIHNGEGPLYASTLWPSLQHYGGYKHYDLHNIFASGMITASRTALLERRPEVRPFIITRSTFAGSGNQTGHWTGKRSSSSSGLVLGWLTKVVGDNASRWNHYRISIKQHIEFASFYQIPTVGTDVCGFNDNATEKMCARWAVLGAWYPFYRNHADISANHQEFYLWPLVTEAARGAIRTRMQLMDYFYTQFHYQTLDGVPRTVLPLFYVYPSDTNTLEIELQFFYGPSIIVSPVTDDDATDVTFYLPRDTFYDFFTGERLDGQGATVTRTGINFTDIPAHIRGGSILPLRIPDGANTTKQLRTRDFELVVAPDANGDAAGRLFLDDGESVSPAATSEISFSYSASNGTLTVDGTFGFNTDVMFARAVLLGEGNKTTVNLDKPLTGPFTASLG